MGWPPSTDAMQAASHIRLETGAPTLPLPGGGDSSLHCWAPAGNPQNAQAGPERTEALIQAVAECPLLQPQQASHDAQEGKGVVWAGPGRLWHRC